VVVALVGVAVFFVVAAVREGMADETEASDSPTVGAESGRASSPSKGGDFNGVGAGAGASHLVTNEDDSAGMLASPADHSTTGGRLGRIAPSTSKSGSAEEAGPSAAGGADVDEVRMAGLVGISDSPEAGSRRSSNGSQPLKAKRVRVSAAKDRSSPAPVGEADVDDVEPTMGAAHKGKRRASVEGMATGARGGTAALDAMAQQFEM